MSALYREPNDIVNACTVLVLAFGDDADKFFPGSMRSHICLRSANAEDQLELARLSEQLGHVHVKMRGEDTNYWVQLKEPIEGYGWLEITGEKTNPQTNTPHPTGPQMLVHIDPKHADAEIINPPSEPRFALRRQNRTAAQIVGTAP